MGLAPGRKAADEQIAGVQVQIRDLKAINTPESLTSVTQLEDTYTAGGGVAQLYTNTWASGNA